SRGPSPARITCTGGGGAATNWLNGTSRATANAHRVSTLGLPAPASSWDKVDLARPARRASSVRLRPARSRSRRTAAAISGCGEDAFVLVADIVAYLFGLTNGSGVVHYIEPWGRSTEPLTGGCCATSGL